MNKREEEKLKKQQEKLQKELERTEAMSVYEKEYSDCTYICGIDEVGRGPFAGPVVMKRMRCLVIKSLHGRKSEKRTQYNTLFSG